MNLQKQLLEKRSHLRNVGKIKTSLETYLGALEMGNVFFSSKQIKGKDLSLIILKIKNANFSLLFNDQGATFQTS